MWLSGVAAGRSLSREPVFPCIRESLLVYLSPPQRPCSTSRHRQDKTRCHIYGAVSSTLMPERLTTGCWDFAAEVNESLSVRDTWMMMVWWCFDYCHSPIRRNWNCYIRGRVCFIMTSLLLLVCFKSSLLLCYFHLCMYLPVLCSQVWSFDRVPRDLIWHSLRSHGAPEEYVRWIQLLYTSAVQCPAGLSEPFPTTVGVHQGSALLPLLFILYMDTATADIQASQPWSTSMECGPQTDGTIRVRG